MHRLGTFALVVLLAGCFTDEKANDRSAELEAVEPSPPPPRFTLDDCRGGAARFELPVARVPVGSEVPPGWTSSGRILAEYRATVVECGRISVGQIERGPIHVLFETHNAVSPPQECMEFKPDFFDFELIRSLWTDDEEVSGYLESVLKMPVRRGAFGYNATAADSNTELQVWDWHAPGGPRSELVFNKVEVIPGGAPEIVRHFWHDGTNLLLMDLEEDTYQPINNPPHVYGRFQPPMMVAGTEHGTYAGVASLVDPGDYDGPIHQFEDMGCKEPKGLPGQSTWIQ